VAPSGSSRIFPVALERSPPKIRCPARGVSHPCPSS
jgi:hypothetical protein